jgi:hypothetical protein
MGLNYETQKIFSKLIEVDSNENNISICVFVATCISGWTSYLQNNICVFVVTCINGFICEMPKIFLTN